MTTHPLSRTALILWCGFMIATLGVLVYRMTSTHLATDFAMFYEAAKAFLQGQDIYTATPWHQYKLPVDVPHDVVKTPIPILGMQYSNNLNTPFFTMLLLPFAHLSYAQGLWIWNALSLLAGGAGLWLLLRVFWPLDTKPWRFIVVFALCLSALPFSLNVGLSETGLFVFFLLTLSWYCARNQRDLSAGFLLGFVCSIKLFAGLLLFFFFLQRRWLLLSVASLTFLSAALFAFLFFGKNAYIEYYSVLHTIFWYTSDWNASVLGYLYRIFGGLKNIYVYYAPHWVKPMYLLSVAALSLLLTFRVSRRVTTQSQFDYHYGLVLIAMLLISPLGWIYYFPVLLLPILLLVKYFERQGAIYHMFFLVIIIYLACIPYHVDTILLMQLAVQLLGNVSLRFYALLLLFALMWFLPMDLIKQLNYREATIKQAFPVTLVFLALLPSFYLLLHSAYGSAALARGTVG